MAFQKQHTNSELNQTAISNSQPTKQAAAPTSGSAGTPDLSGSTAVRRPVLKTWQANQDDNQGDKDMTVKKLSKKMIATLLTVVIIAGIGTGLAAAYFIPVGQQAAVKPEDQQEVADNQVKEGMVVGVPDEKTFSDQSEGVLIKGGLDGEGSHTLLRPNGESQNIYLTSSVADLDQFIDMKIRVWGETFKGQKAGWLMDVGRIEVLDTTAEKPEWYQATN